MKQINQEIKHWTIETCPMLPLVVREKGENDVYQVLKMSKTGLQIMGRNLRWYALLADFEWWNGDEWVPCGENSLMERPKKLRPWKLHEFMGKYIRAKCDSVFGLACMNYRDCTVGTAFSRWGTSKWWFNNGECLLPDGSFGPCGEVE